MEQIFFREKALNIPNLLTLLRIALLPAIVWRFRVGDLMGALSFYLAAMLTDVFDGMIARKFNQITSLGKLLDPIADKLSLLTLLWLFAADGQIPRWVLMIVAVKEAALLIGGAAALRRGIVTGALPIGKLTTISFVLSVIARFLSMKAAADFLLEVSVVFSIAALLWYAVVMVKELTEYDTVSTK